jgi:hypothetical protein
VTPTLSVEADQLRLTCALEAAVAVRLPGALGGVVSGALLLVVALAVLEAALTLPAASVA